MIIYVFIVFIALCVGMAVSVYAFGTGGKRKRIFQDIYFSVEEADGIGVIYTKTGEYSAVLKLENPVQKYCANIDSYYEFTQLFTAIAQTLGEGYAIHKQDIFIRKKFTEESNENREFLLFPLLQRQTLYRQRMLPDYHTGSQEKPFVFF